MTYKIAQTIGKKNAAQHRKPNIYNLYSPYWQKAKCKYYTLHQGLYRSNGDISDISTLISLISVSNRSSNDNVKTV